MITMTELLSGQCTFEECTPEQQKNLTILLEKVNKLRIAYGKPMTVTSGLRTMKHHLEIYAKKGIFPPKVPTKSNHLFGRAVDFADSHCELKKFVNNNIPLMKEIGLWMEDFEATPTWLHVQINPPASGKLFFKP
jgi:hypothetical protein